MAFGRTLSSRIFCLYTTVQGNLCQGPQSKWTNISENYLNFPSVLNTFQDLVIYEWRVRARLIQTGAGKWRNGNLKQPKTQNLKLLYFFYRVETAYNLECSFNFNDTLNAFNQCSSRCSELFIIHMCSLLLDQLYHEYIRYIYLNEHVLQWTLFSE